MLTATNSNDGKAKALLILLDAREALAPLFDDWSEIDEIRSDHELAPIADIYRSIGKTIEHLGGPSLEAIYALQNHVFADIPDDIEEASAIAGAIFQHCSAIASR